MDFYNYIVKEQIDQNLINKVVDYLNKLSVNYYLLGHLTDVSTALKIIKNDDFSDKGVHGTSLFYKTDDIVKTLYKIYGIKTGDKSLSGEGGVSHRTSDAIVLMAIPKVFLPKPNTMDLDDKLADLFDNNKIKTFGVPNQYIIGCWKYDGTFYSNSKFNPKGLLV